MNVKIDTKDKFTVVTPTISDVSANMAAELLDSCSKVLQNDVKNLILNLSVVQNLHQNAFKGITDLQQLFYEKSASFVICGITPLVEQQLEALDVLELWNITPTESEAWDIVQMEEIERELLDSDDFSFEKND